MIASLSRCVVGAILISWGGGEDGVRCWVSEAGVSVIAGPRHTGAVVVVLLIVNSLCPAPCITWGRKSSVSPVAGLLKFYHVRSCCCLDLDSTDPCWAQDSVSDEAKAAGLGPR